MAFTPTQQLTNTSSVVQRDYQHAARLFTDDQFRLAPKHKFLFAVQFTLNKSALRNIELVDRHGYEIGMLVKAIDLPNFSITTETLNQYNRKKNVQVTHKFNPSNITFHDDNMGVINMLWQNYYNYYYADSSSAADTVGGYNRIAMKSSDYIKNTYGLDNNSSIPFFNSIKIFQMARHEFVSYTLINPIITSWNHNKLDYSQSGIHDNQMGIAYEAVTYGSGVLTDDGLEPVVDLSHYDQTPSPLQGKSSGLSSSPSFANNRNTTSGETISNKVASVNAYQNSKELATSVPGKGLSSIIGTAAQGFSGIQGVKFPQSTSLTNAKTVVATAINIFRK
jgi:hypothetical protein